MVDLFSFHGALVVSAITLPFGFYTVLWKRSEQWVQLCKGKNGDPSHAMAQISHVLKLLQIVALASVATYSSLPPWYGVILFVLGQYLNFKTYDLLGEAGVYYGALFGKQLPWVEKFPFGYIRDPQYWGSILSLLGVASCNWIPFKFILLWIFGYLYMMVLEREENPDLRHTKVS